MADLASRYGARRHSLQVIPNGIDAAEIGLEPSAPLPFFKSDEPKKLLFVGSLAPVKGLDTLIDACLILRQRRQVFSLTIAGRGTPFYEDHYRCLVEASHLDHIVNFIGHVPRSHLGALLQRHHLMVVPSLSEPLPTVVLEAMIAGCPVIGSDVGGIPFLLDGGQAGGIVSPGSSLQLADTITHIMQDPQAMNRFIQKAHQRASTLFSWESCGETLSYSIGQILHDKA